MIAQAIKDNGEEKPKLVAYVEDMKAAGGLQYMAQEIKVCRLAKAWDSKKT